MKNKLLLFFCFIFFSSKLFAEDLFEISDEFNNNIHLLQNFGIKHGDNLLIYSAHGNGFGNSAIPKEKIRVK